MTTKSKNGATVPVGSDPYALTADLLKMMESAGLVYPVPDEATMLAIPSPGVGMVVSRLDLGGQLWYWTGSAWARNTGAPNRGAATDLTALQGTWAAPFSGVRRPRVWSPDGITAFSTGIVQYNGSNANIVSVPAPFAPTKGTDITYIGSSQASSAGGTAGGPSVALGIQGGIMKVVYQSGTLPTGMYLPIVGLWTIDG